MRASSTTLKHSKCPHRSAGPLEQAPSTAGPSHLAYPSSAASAPIPQPQAGFKPDLNAITEAHKYALPLCLWDVLYATCLCSHYDLPDVCACRLAKYAASSLGFEDVPSAVKYLTDALTLLTQPSRR